MNLHFKLLIPRNGLMVASRTTDAACAQLCYAIQRDMSCPRYLFLVLFDSKHVYSELDPIAINKLLSCTQTLSLLPV